MEKFIRNKGLPIIVILTSFLFLIDGIGRIIVGSFLETGLSFFSQLTTLIPPELQAELTLLKVTFSGMIALNYLASIASILVGIGIWKLKKWAGYIGIVLSLISIGVAFFDIAASLGSLIYSIILLSLTISILKYLK